MELIISIVVYKEDPAQLAITIDAVLGSDLQFHLYIMDNSPDQGLREKIPQDSRLDYIHLPQNIGFGAAHNEAIRRANHCGTYHLVLNPDVVFDPRILRQMIEFLNITPKVGLLAPKVLYPNGDLQRLCKLLPTPVDVFLRRFLPGSSFVKRRNHHYELVDKAYNRACRIPSISGCFMLFRTSTLWQAGLFDESFFMYFEDIDITRRVATYQETVFSPDFEITHAYKKESYRSFRLLWIHITSAIHYFNKWGWVIDHERARINRETLTQF